MEIILMFVFVLSVLGLVLVKVVLPKAQQADRRRAIEREMRQQIIDRETERKVARKILQEVGRAG